MMVKGYFGAYGSFRSDDVKQVICLPTQVPPLQRCIFLIRSSWMLPVIRLNIYGDGGSDDGGENPTPFSRVQVWWSASRMRSMNMQPWNF